MFRCPVCYTVLLATADAFEEDIVCPSCGLLVSLCENCGRALRPLRVTQR